MEWIPARENLALIGPAGTGKSHTLIALGHAAVHAGYKVKYAAAADLVETLYRGLADNTVGKTIETLLRHDVLLLDEVGFAPLDDTGTQLLFRLVAAAYERRSLGIASHGRSRTGAGSCPSTPPRSASSTGSCTTPPPWSPPASPTACATPKPGQEAAPPPEHQPRGVGTFTWPPAGT